MLVTFTADIPLPIALAALAALAFGACVRGAILWRSTTAQKHQVEHSASD